MSATVSSTFSRRFRRVAAGLAASLALGALSAHAAPMPFPADFRSSQVVNADATIDEATRRHYAAIYARPGAMHSAFAQFLAIAQKDEADNLKAMETKLTMPVLAIGAEKAFGANVAVIMRNAATNVQEVIVPNAGHWLM